MAAGSVAASWPLATIAAPRGRAANDLTVGEATVDTTPPLGIELAGFHRRAPDRRLIERIRKKSAARALVIRHGDTQAAIISLDILSVSKGMTQRIQTAVEKTTSIPAAHVRLTATHTHSMPTFYPLLHWGAVSREYMKSVEQKCVQSVQLAQQDLTKAALYVGSARTDGANFNRTARETGWKSEVDFTASSSDSERWLDQALHVLRFERSGEKDILWYQFCAHPICYRDTDAGPDWPGVVDEHVEAKLGVTPSFLQGHIGDVNPGDGETFRGDPIAVGQKLFAAIHGAVENGQRVSVNNVRVVNDSATLQFDMERFKDELAMYEALPEKPTRDDIKAARLVDGPFAQSWYASAKKWDASRTSISTPISALRLGDVCLFFHSTELYSYYGLRVQHDSPFSKTIAVGYADDFVGYVTDAKAYDDLEYAAVVVPKILGLPPFKTQTATRFTERATRLLRRLA